MMHLKSIHLFYVPSRNTYFLTNCSHIDLLGTKKSWPMFKRKHAKILSGFYRNLVQESKHCWRFIELKEIDHNMYDRTNKSKYDHIWFHKIHTFSYVFVCSTLSYIASIHVDLRRLQLYQIRTVVWVQDP